MFSYDKPFLFRNTASNLEYCTDTLENTEWNDLQWDCPNEEKASHQIREWCMRYIAAYDYHHGAKPDE